jgi:hypothetical protein
MDIIGAIAGVASILGFIVTIGALFRKQDRKQLKYFISFTIISFIIASYAVGTSDDGKPATQQTAQQPQQAKPYQVLKEKDTSTIDRSRREAWIYSADARSTDERAKTVMQAAIDLRNKYTAHSVWVFLEPDAKTSGKGDAVASAVYAPDGLGYSGAEHEKWSVTTTDDKGYHPYKVKE